MTATRARALRLLAAALALQAAALGLSAVLPPPASIAHAIWAFCRLP